jgi:polysaccharide biosynthesis transport protein
VEIGQYLHVLRAHRVLVVLCVLAGTAAAATLALTRTPIYAAETQLFVSDKSRPEGAGQAYEGGLYAQQRARSYAGILSSPRGAQAAIEQLGLHESVESVQDKVRATVPADSLLINVTVTDQSARRAKSIADSLGRLLPALAEQLETPEGRERSPVLVTVTQPAQLPTDPISPRKPIYLVLGALFGLAVGVGAAVLRRALDHRIRSDAVASATAGAPVLGSIAEHPDQAMSPVVLRDPLSDAAEGYRGLRANLRALCAEHEIRSFVVSSAAPAEGKTEVVANLGVTLAEAGERVVVVDANLRSPRLGELLGVGSVTGLTDLLETRGPIELALHRHPTAPLEVLTSGSPRPNPSELLDSEGFDRVLEALTDRFDFVIVDTPALLAVADAAALARRASGAILVARAASTSSDELGAARQALRPVDGRVLGVVLNGVREGDRWLYREDPLPPRSSRSRMVAPVPSDGHRSSEWSH